VTRSEAKANEYRSAGYAAIVADVTKPETLVYLPPAETVLFAVGYDRNSARAIEDVYAGGVRNVLRALPEKVARFTYISTTGVYGPAGGEWVDEATPTDPQRDGGRASLAAEQTLAAHDLGKHGVILRLAGIYGPGRLPFINELRSGRPIPAPAEGYLNVIHVDDAAQFVVSADQWLANQAPAETPHVFCVSDGHPVTRTEYYRELARQLGAPAPRFVDPEPGSPRAARAMSNRRVRNERMLAELRVNLKYPSYREGLAKILETENQPGRM
jgi:nucleoside-diphosphate-sugar epimerase